jgi:SAM-dependent methyltransferase
MKSNWPKVLPVWSAEQSAIADDFMHFWHQTYAEHYPLVERFNHGYPMRCAPAQFGSTLEIGCGLGDHIAREKLTPAQQAAYVAVDMRESMVDVIRSRFPLVRAIAADIEQRLDFPDGAFGRVIAIHVLEHLPNLPRALAEIHRLLAKPDGAFLVVIPCEGGLGYAAARKVSSQRLFERRYRTSYRWFIEREHINSAREIAAEIGRLFVVRHRRFYPLRVPMIDLNLCIGMTLVPAALDGGRNAHAGG